jgi:hypothetical protein
LTLADDGRTAIRHKSIQAFLSPLDVDQVASLKHLAVVPKHLLDIDRIVAAIFRSIMVDIAGRSLSIV